jgi:hypothetical protein
MASSLVNHFIIGDNQERGPRPESASELLHKVAEQIATLGPGEITDLVVDTGSYYYVTQIHVYSATRDKASTSSISHLVEGGHPNQTVPELLRRTADTIEQLGEVDVQGLVMHSNDDIDGLGRGRWISIYYRALPRGWRPR